MPQSKTQTGKLNKKSKPLLCCIQVHLISKDTQNKGLEEDLPSKWRAKKSRSCNSHL